MSNNTRLLGIFSMINHGWMEDMNKHYFTSYTNDVIRSAT